MPKRTENFGINLSLDGKALSLHDRCSIYRLLDVKVDNGDSLDVNYDLDIEYFDKTVDTIELIIELFDKATIKTVNTKELAHGRSLIQELPWASSLVLNINLLNQQRRDYEKQMGISI